MNHSIILIPTSKDVDIKVTAHNLSTKLKEKNITSHLLPEFNLEAIEKLLATNSQEELLESIVKQHELATNNKKFVIVQGVPLIKPYAAELNFAIATALGVPVIFVSTIEQNSATSLRQTKIVINPYKTRHEKTILGFIANQEASTAEKDLKLSYLGDFVNNYDLKQIQQFLATPFTQPITAPLFKYHLIEKAKEANKKIILPEGDEPRTIEAANICTALGIAQCILLAEKEKIQDTCNKYNLKLHEKITIIEPKTIKEKYITPLYEIRKAKGLTLEQAKEQLKDNTMLGTMMLHTDEVDGLVSGAIHTSANTIRPAFQIIKTATNVKLISSVFFMCLPDQVLVYGDCAINPNPNPEELADIAIQSAATALSFGITPKIAMLSYSTGNSGKGPEVDKVRKATEIVKSLRPDLEIEGPIQYDAAISEKTAKIKLPESTVAGFANLFIMPNLDVGNIVYKAVQRSTNIVSIGPTLQGLRKPVNDLSRGCSVSDIVFTIAVTAIQTINHQ